MSESTLTNKERRMARKAERQQKKEAEHSNEALAPSKRRKERDFDEAAEEPQYDEAPADEVPDEDVEPLSHKEQRKRRKMEKMAEKYGTMHKEAAAPARPERSPYSVWIGNLSFTTSEDDLRQWLSDHAIEGVSRVHMTPGARRTDHNKGYVSLRLTIQLRVRGLAVGRHGAAVCGAFRDVVRRASSSHQKWHRFPR